MSARPNFKRIDDSRSRLDQAEEVARSAQPANSGCTVDLVNGASIKAVAIRWLWLHWLAAGKLHILAGAPGCGKTTIMLALIATLTTGGRWPDGTRASIGNVLIWSGEDDPADTLVPRLLAMNADLQRVFFIKAVREGNESRPFDPSTDMSALLTAAEGIGGVRLLVVDPVVSAVAGDSHKNAEVRRGLQPLVDLGAALDCAVVGITHLSKGTAGREPTERVTGSIAFGAVARMVLLAAKTRSDEGEERRIMVRAKTNIAPDDGGFEYRIEQREAQPGIEASALTWGLAIDGTARDLLADAEAEPKNDDCTATDGVDGFVRGLLRDGPASAKNIKADADGAGYAWRTIQLSATRLGVKREKRGMKEGWWWSLVGAQSTRRRIEDAEDASQKGHAPSAPSTCIDAPSDDGEVL